MNPEASPHIPVLTDAIPADAESEGDAEKLREDSELALEAPPRPDLEILIAELQTKLASDTFRLAEEVMRGAFSEMEAQLIEQISARLRRELPELIDTVLRESLADPDPDPR